MERYRGVLGRRRVASTTEALEASGAVILRAPNPSEAPFEYTIRTPSGDTIDLVCYAFTANKYRQRGRPRDEHRFQVKYGSEFDRPHRIFIDKTRARVTLMYGVHDSIPAFIAVDPAMHNPTWFSSSVELKQDDLAQSAKGWFGWERDRMVAGRRRVQLPDQDLRTEVLIGFRPEHFLTYVLFERLATGMDPGERLALADQIGHRIRKRRTAHDLLELPNEASARDLTSHPLLAQLGLSAEELLGVIGGRFRLLAAVRGSVAEHHLGRALTRLPALDRVTRLDEDGKPDFVVEYRERAFRIECKNVLGRRVGKTPRVDFQKTRASKGDPCSRYYDPRQFEILAACLHPVTAKWEFSYCATRTLDPHRKCPGRLSERVLVDGPTWTEDLPEMLDRLSVE